MFLAGLLAPSPPEFVVSDLPAALQSWLEDLGYAEGVNVRWATRFAVGGEGRLRALAAELAALNVDVIVAEGTAAALAARGATTRAPIVVSVRSDPVARGLVPGRDEPGRRIAGVTTWSPRLVRQRVELLLEALQRVERLAVLWNPDDLDTRDEFAETGRAAGALGVEVEPVPVRRETEMASAMAAARRCDAALVLADRWMAAVPDRLPRWLLRSRLPAMYSHGRFVEGPSFAPEVRGLLSFGPSGFDVAQELAILLDRVFRGAPVATLPLARVTRFYLAVNRKAARALGLSFPPSLLRRADQVIE